MIEQAKETMRRTVQARRRSVECLTECGKDGRKDLLRAPLKNPVRVFGFGFEASASGDGEVKRCNASDHVT